jgi:cytidine deaminase
MMLDQLARFEQILATFPESVRLCLSSLPEQSGKLSYAVCQQLTNQLNISMEQLMVKLLPLAGVFAHVPISGFTVGAVAQAESRLEPSQRELYLGANLEFENMALNTTIHAEQSATLNAWHQDAGRLLAVATSETPCGHCRQFLHEFYGGLDLAVIQPGQEKDDCRILPINDLLVQPFTPADLNNHNALMGPGQLRQPLKLKDSSDDPLVAAALEAANTAYAPYTGNVAGCAVQIRNQNIISGRSMESVAFNPSVSALHAAVIRINLMALEVMQNFERVALVERPTKVRQKESIQVLMNTVMPDIMLEYHLAQEETE